MRHPILLAAALTAAAATVDSQVTVVDEGRFIITRDGRRIGSEDFVIRRTPGAGGDVLTGTATVAYDERRLAPALRTDPKGSPLAYQVEIRVGPEVQESLRGQIGRGRFSARIRTPGGESAKEYIVSDGAVILDDEVFHQYYFLGMSARAGSVPVVVPRRNVQVSMRVQTGGGSEMVEIGGTRVAARHLEISEPGGTNRHVWLDSQGRVLKVTVDGVTATRDELPR
ncbi:MAG TPA: hypothetical protein VK922_14630 [Gemmatimonadaceae bacterium]|nr:hypothetical protein [Gemmatimonadaceae bacterium]